MDQSLVDADERMRSGGMPNLAFSRIPMMADPDNSIALAADSRETLVCTYLSVATLLGLAANALFGWWWADPVAALALVVLVAREGLEVVRNRELVCIDD